MSKGPSKVAVEFAESFYRYHEAAGVDIAALACHFDAFTMAKDDWLVRYARARDAMLEAYRGVLSQRVILKSPESIERMQAARVALDTVVMERCVEPKPRPVAAVDTEQYFTRCPRCRKLANFPRDANGFHHCSQCGEAFTGLEVMGWMQP